MLGATSDCHCHTIWDSKILATEVAYIARNGMINLLAPELFFLILAHPVYRM
jgi:hypothetical protein